MKYFLVFSQPTAIVLLVKLKLSHKSGETAVTLIALRMSSAKKAFVSQSCLDIPGFHKGCSISTLSHF